MECGSAQSLGIGGPLTLEAWIKPTRKANGEAVIMGESLSTYLLTYYNTEISLFYIGSGANNVRGHVTLNEWNHVVATFDGSTMNMWINGQLTQSRTSAFTSYQLTGNFFMGTKDRPDLPISKGLMDKVRIHESALTGQQALDHFETEASEYGYDPDLFVNPQGTSYYYLLDTEPTAVVETEYVWLHPVNGRLEVNVANSQTPNNIILQRVRNPVPDIGAVDVTLPLSGLADGDYIIDVSFEDSTGIDYTE